MSEKINSEYLKNFSIFLHKILFFEILLFVDFYE